jgi:hypothetical protein
LSPVARVLLALVILVVDLVVFFVPLCAVVIAVVIVARPRWALAFVASLYEGVQFGAGPAAAADEPARRSRPE